MLVDRPKILRQPWVLCLSLFAGYALLSLISSLFQIKPASVHDALAADKITNAIKFIINFFFLICGMSWFSNFRRKTSVAALDNTLHIVFLFTIVQLLVYIAHAGGTSIGTAVDSSTAAAIYDPSYFFWGMPDKNVLGARIALFGFLYILMALVRNNKFPFYRCTVVLLSAFLSNSRTPMVALFIGIAFVIFRRSRLSGKILLVLIVSGIAPFFLVTLIRFDSLFSSSDGMGVRLVYWSTFLTHLKTLPMLGSGFMSAEPFLTKYSPIYLGEPHLHNVFFNTYLDFGLPGICLYTLFLLFFYRSCKKTISVPYSWYLPSAFLPLIAIMLTLSTGYESDTVLYLLTLFIIGRTSPNCRRQKIFPEALSTPPILQTV